MRRLFAAALWALTGVAQGSPFQPPANSRQLVVAVGATLDASEVVLRRYQRDSSVADWVAVGPAVRARIGKRGMAWGRGLHGDVPPPTSRAKREGDWRAPMGLFAIGDAFGDAKVPPRDARWAYRQVTENDLWVEDTSAPTYNQHIRVPNDRPRTEWEESQRMKMGDPAHRLKIVIQHNTGNIRSGAGSAIFFHIWRQDGARPTSGCTAMAASELETLLAWLKPGAAPVYVLVDEAHYAKAKAAGALP